ncbi:MAG: CpaF family protein [Candidatus Anstonellales archaeon]
MDEQKKVSIGGFKLKEEKKDIAVDKFNEISETLRNILFTKYLPNDIINDLNSKGRKYVYAKCTEELAKIIRSENIDLKDIPQSKIIESIVSEITGYGPIERLLYDDAITEIMVNGPKKVFVEKDGKIMLTEISFENEEQLRRLIDKIVQPLGRRIDESSPLVDARLPDGSRVNVIIPPLSEYPVLTIRKFRKDVFREEDLIRLGSIDQKTIKLLNLFVRSKLNIIVSGGTGTGKTTFLNFLSGMIDPEERIITIEDSKELKLNKPHVIYLESRPPNIEGKGEVTIRDLVRNALRMRPDRIVVGEVRGQEAFDMLQAMNTGHDGSMSTIHANSPEDIISRLIAMVLMTGAKLTEKAISLMIVGGIDIIVHLYRFEDGSRKVGLIGEFVEDPESELGIKFVPIVEFKRLGLDEKGKVFGEYRFIRNENFRFIRKMQLHGFNFKDFVQELMRNG